MKWLKKLYRKVFPAPSVDSVLADVQKKLNTLDSITTAKDAEVSALDANIEKLLDQKDAALREVSRAVALQKKYAEFVVA
jgi:hypothetical protein